MLLRYSTCLLFAAALVLVAAPEGGLGRPASERRAAAPTQATPPSPTAQTKAKISPAQAEKLFQSVDAILRFDSRDTGLRIHSKVKRRLITREQAVAFLTKKMEEDKDTQRMERSAAVLEKFGLLPPEFALRTFLLRLLGEQVAGFYDTKTKTVNLLDWLDADTQKPTLAHELTHALQDQFEAARGVSLDKWENAGPDAPAADFKQDRERIRTDETDTAREAVLEGQAMVAYMDWGLDGRGRTLRTLPQITLGQLQQAQVSDTSSSMLDSAPLVLRESLLFPYQDGLVFEQQVLKDKGTEAAFAGMLRRPPDSSWAVMHPGAYERGEQAPVLAMPNLHPLLDAEWAPYDVGVMGALDVRMLAAALADRGAGADAALDWDGGLYYAARRRDAKPGGDPAAALGLVYLSRWKTETESKRFAALYRASLRKRFKGLQSPADSGAKTVDLTEDGPMLVDRRGLYVFVSQTFALGAAEQVEGSMLAAQGASGGKGSAFTAAPGFELTAPLQSFFTRMGLMRAGIAPVY